MERIPQRQQHAPRPTLVGHLRKPAEAPGREHVRGQLAFRRACVAFTLVEMVVALAIAALLAIMTLPAFHEWIGAYQLANHAKHLAETMTRARTEAVRRGHRVNLCKSFNIGRCADQGNWDSGFVVFVDINRNGKIDDGEPVLQTEGIAPHGISVSANRPVDDYVSYTNLGQARMLNGALQMGTFVVCSRGQRALHVVLAHTGRVRIERTSDRCP